MTADKLVNQYDDITVFYSNAEFDQAKMDAGDEMFFLPAVQDLKFDFSRNAEKRQSIGSKRKNIIYPNQAPDVSVDISILENFETLFEDIFTGGSVVSDLNSGKNFYFLLNGDEKRTALNSYKSSVSVGNCFLNSVSVNQSVNGILTSDYSYVGSNIIAQEFNGVPINGTDKYAYSSGQAPSVILTGSQQPVGNFVFNEIGEKILGSNYNGEFVPGCKTFVKVSGIGTDTSFLIKPNNIQSFNIDIDLNRKRINSVGKYFPLIRKASAPFFGKISLENKFSDIETGDSFINFLKNPEEYHISISGEKPNGKAFLIDVSKAFLESKSVNGSISSHLSEKADFIFALENSALLTNLTSINTWSQNNLIIWDSNDFIWDTINP
tara:strand:+ start:1984 stop:3123 length:1140 start_codon:yes stop_codon:yes gene_type:complete